MCVSLQCSVYHRVQAPSQYLYRVSCICCYGLYRVPCICCCLLLQPWSELVSKNPEALAGFDEWDWLKDVGTITVPCGPESVSSSSTTEGASNTTACGPEATCDNHQSSGIQTADEQDLEITRSSLGNATEVGSRCQCLCQAVPLST